MSFLIEKGESNEQFLARTIGAVNPNDYGAGSEMVRRYKDMVMSVYRKEYNGGSFVIDSELMRYEKNSITDL